MTMETAIWVVVIFVFGLCISFFVGYRTGYLRYESLCADLLDELQDMASKNQQDKEEVVE